MSYDAELKAKVSIDGEGANKSIDKLKKTSEETDKKINQLASSFQKTGAIMTATMTVPIVAFGKKAVGMASEVEASQQQVNRIFGESVDIIDKFTKETANSYLMSTKSATKFASIYGNLISGIAKDQEENANLTEKVLKASAVIASSTGRTIEDVNERIRSGLLGNTEAIEDLGVNVNVAMLESTDAFKKFAGDKSWGQLDFQTQQQIRLMAILEQTNKKYGDTIQNNTSSNMARLTADFENLTTELGQVMLPIFNDLLGKVRDFVKWIGSLDKNILKTVVTITSFLAVARPLLALIGTGIKIFSFLKTVIIGVKTAMIALNAVMLANPIILIIALVIGLIAVIWYFRDEIWLAITTSYDFLKGILQSVWEFISGVFTNIYNTISGVITNVLSVLSVPFDFLKNAFLLVVALVATIIEQIWNFIKPFIDKAIGIFQTLFNFIMNNVINPIVNTFRNAFNTIWGIVSPIVEKIMSIFGKVGDFIKTTFENVKNFVSNIFSGIVGIIKTPINGIIGAINKVLGSMNNIKVPDWVPGLGGKSVNFKMIPSLDVGTNYVAQDGLAYIHKGEAVVPKQYNPALGGGAQTIIIEPSQSDVIMDGSIVGRILTPQITRVIKQGGGAY